jgi:hypothetical protein
MGIFMLIWVVSGIMISVPSHWLEHKAEGGSHKIDFTAFSLSPADVIVKLKQNYGTSFDVKSLGFQKIGDKELYSIRVKKADDLLVDARTGELFKVTPELAESIVREGFNIETPVLENTSLNKHVISYAWGPLPVYRLKFSGDASNIYYVNPMSGRVHQSSLLTRARMGAGFLHSFRPVEMLTGRESMQVGALVIVGIVSLIGLLAGVYLIFPLGKRK